MRDACGDLPERRHFLRMDQTGLRHLQVAQGFFGGVPRCTNGFFGLLPCGDVGIDQHDAATGYRIPTYLDDASVRAGALEEQLMPWVFVGAAQLSFDIGRVLAPISKIAEELGIAWSSRKKGVG